MYIVDSHCDSIARVVDGTYGMVNPYNFSKKRLQLQYAAMFCAWEGDTVQQAHERTVRYVERFRRAMEDEKDRILWVKSWSDIEAAFASGRHAALLALESATGLKGDPQILREFYRTGVRVVGLTWLSNELAKSNRLAEGEEDTGLTAAGREIVAEGNRLGIIFDVSHNSDQTFWDTAELSAKPIMATHSNFRKICGHSRNLTDEMAREIIRQDGMIGLNLCTDFVHETKSRQTVEELFRHLEHCMALGGEDHIGFGCDVDGIGGVYPAPLTEEDSIHDQLIEQMLRHNYSEELTEKVAGGNHLRFLEKYL